VELEEKEEEENGGIATLYSHTHFFKKYICASIHLIGFMDFF
jgi:hypothetical protein